jgi:hypothetical protein
VTVHRQNWNVNQAARARRVRELAAAAKAVPAEGIIMSQKQKIICIRPPMSADANAEDESELDASTLALDTSLSDLAEPSPRLVALGWAIWQVWQPVLSASKNRPAENGYSG